MYTVVCSIKKKIIKSNAIFVVLRLINVGVAHVNDIKSTFTSNQMLFDFVLSQPEFKVYKKT